MRINKLVLALLGTTLLVGASGCLIRARGGGEVAYVVDAEPPPPRNVYVDYRPGYVWVDGYWYWTGADWSWREGYYVAERPGYYYTQGVWVTVGGRHQWRPGRWERGGGDGHWQRTGNHYTYRPNNGGGVVVREHGAARPANVNVKVRVKAKPAGGGARVKVREH